MAVSGGDAERVYADIASFNNVVRCGRAVELDPGDVVVGDDHSIATVRREAADRVGAAGDEDAVTGVGQGVAGEVQADHVADDNVGRTGQDDPRAVEAADVQPANRHIRRRRE